jgi:hypothetical protein
LCVNQFPVCLARKNFVSIYLGKIFEFEKKNFCATLPTDSEL